MVKHTQTICRQFANELFECVWPFSEIGAYACINKSQISFWEKQKSDLN